MFWCVQSRGHSSKHRDWLFQIVPLHATQIAIISTQAYQKPSLSANKSCTTSPNLTQTESLLMILKMVACPECGAGADLTKDRLWAHCASCTLNRKVKQDRNV